MAKEDVIKFAIPIDLEKGQNDKGEITYKLKGLASTTGKDTAGETLLAKQFRLDDFKQINWNHKGGEDAGAVIGGIEKHYFNKDGLNIEGELYPEMDMTHHVVSLSKALKKRGKRLQLSVEGQVLQRGSKDKNHPDYKKVLKANLTGVAVTPMAVNQETFADIIEKGVSNVEWIYDEETEQLVKSAMKGELKDDDIVSCPNCHIALVEDKCPECNYIGKAMTAGNTTGTQTTNQESNGAALKKEDLEKGMGVANTPGHETLESGKGVDKPENTVAQDVSKNHLSKSAVYENIFDYFCSIDSTEAKQIYQLIEKISAMSKQPVSKETLAKAFEIIELAAAEQNKEAKTLDSAMDLIKAKHNDLEPDQIVEELVKAEFSEEVAKEAAEKHKKAKKKKKDGKKKDEDDEEEDEDDEEEDEMKKSIESLKLATEEYQNTSDMKMGAIGVILKSQTELIEKLVEANETQGDQLNKALEALEKISKTPLKKAPITNAMQRFAETEDGGKTYNLKSKVQRKALADKLEELSGFNDGNGINGTGKYDESLMKAASDIELVGVFSSAKVIPYLAEVHKINVVSE